MKKSLIALAVLAASGAAMAQSSVTLFGIVDAAVAFGRGSVSDRTQLANSGYNSSRLGFRGTEDLGGGLAASFWLEAGFGADSGTGQATSLNNQPGAANSTSGGGLTFNRRATLSLSGGFGEIRLGRDYTPQFKNLDSFDPFGTNGVGSNQVYNGSLGGPTITRASNSASYFLPSNLGGFYGQVQGYLGENPTGSTVPAIDDAEDNGNGVAARVGFANGPIDVAIATSLTKYNGAGLGDIKSSNAAASYDFGVAKIMAVYGQDKVSNGLPDGKGAMLGVTAPIGAGLIRASYSTYKIETAGTDPRVDKVALGYVHNLSKRTALYTTVAHVKNKGGASAALNGALTGPNDNSTGYDIGVRHAF